MVCGENVAAVDNLLGCMETDDDDGEEGEAVPTGNADGVHDDITESAEDGLTVVVWICKLLGRKLLSFEGGKVPGELVCGKQVDLTDNIVDGADGIVGPEVESFEGKLLRCEVIVVG